MLCSQNSPSDRWFRRTAASIVSSTDRRLGRRSGSVAAAIALAVACLVPGAALAQTAQQKLEQNRERQQQIKRQMSAGKQRAKVLSSRIESFTRRMNELNAPIAELDRQISSLEAQIAARRARIAELRVEFKRQEGEIKRLDAEADIARERLADRLVTTFKQGEPSHGSWLLGIDSISDLVDRQEMVGQITELDSNVVTSIEELERRVRVKRARNRAVQEQIATDIAGIEADEREVSAARAKLAARRSELEQARAERAQYLAQLGRQQQELSNEHSQLESDSRRLAETIRAAAEAQRQAARAAARSAASGGSAIPAAPMPSGPSPSGLIWPVHGPVTSGFGPRWGRMHEGIDIGVRSGTPIRASASGVVSYSGWMSGYGNLVVVQHAGSLSTSYAHMSRIGAGNGQAVTQGAIIGWVGCTGRCFGDHLHYETRINGSAVDPMGYL